MNARKSMLGKPSSHKLSLRMVLIAACVLPLVTSISLIEYLSWRNGQQAAEALALDLQQRLGDRIQDRLQSYMAVPPQVAGMMAHALNRGDLAADRLDAWAPYLFDQGQFFDSLTYLYFGNPDGDYIELAQTPNLADQVVLTLGDRPELSIFFEAQDPSRPERQGSEQAYDPRTRPWYKAATKDRGQWTEVYEFAASDILGIPKIPGLSFVRPYTRQINQAELAQAESGSAEASLDQQEQPLLGVIGADLSLEGFTQFLNQLNIGKSGQAFVIDREGRLLATSLPQPVIGDDGQQLVAVDNPNPLIRATSQYLIEQFDNFRHIDQVQSLSFIQAGQRQRLQVNPFQDEFGLDWLIVIVVPESDFTEQLRATARLNLGLSLGGMGLAGLLAAFIAHRISLGMLKLKQASQAIAEGQLEQVAFGFATDELHAVGQAFNTMNQRLAESFAHLEEKVAERTKQLQQQKDLLQEKEQFLRTIYEGVEAAIFTMQVEEGAEGTAEQRQFRCIDVSPAHSRMSRLTREQIINQTPQDYLDPRAAELVTQEYQACMATGDRISYENRLEHNGHTSWWLTTISPLKDTEGQIYRLIVTGLNITQRKEAELRLTERTQELYETLQELRKTQEQLIESAKMAALGKLVAGVAHEVNTPVGTAMLAASTLDSETQALNASLTALKQSSALEGATELEEYLDLAIECSQIILDNLNRAGDLVQSFKQIAVDQTYFQPRQFELKAYIEEVILSLKPQLDQTLHQVQLDGDEAMMESDPGIVAQIITNLVINSLTHAYAPQQAGVIRIMIKAQEDSLQLCYQDDGRGMTPETLDRIFDPFFTTASLATNSGLGLHLVYNLVTQRLQGAIAVESELGQGSRFTLSLPLRSSALQAEADFTSNESDR